MDSFWNATWMPPLLAVVLSALAAMAATAAATKSIETLPRAWPLWTLLGSAVLGALVGAGALVAAASPEALAVTGHPGWLGALLGGVAGMSPEVWRLARAAGRKAKALISDG